MLNLPGQIPALLALPAELHLLIFNYLPCLEDNFALEAVLLGVYLSISSNRNLTAQRGGMDRWYAAVLEKNWNISCKFLCDKFGADALLPFREICLIQHQADIREKMHEDEDSVFKLRVGNAFNDSKWQKLEREKNRLISAFQVYRSSDYVFLRTYHTKKKEELAINDLGLGIALYFGNTCLAKAHLQYKNFTFNPVDFNVLSVALLSRRVSLIQDLLEQGFEFAHAIPSRKTKGKSCVGRSKNQNVLILQHLPFTQIEKWFTSQYLVLDQPMLVLAAFLNAWPWVEEQFSVINNKWKKTTQLDTYSLLLRIAAFQGTDKFSIFQPMFKKCMKLCEDIQQKKDRLSVLCDRILIPAFEGGCVRIVETLLDIMPEDYVKKNMPFIYVIVNGALKNKHEKVVKCLEKKKGIEWKKEMIADADEKNLPYLVDYLKRLFLKIEEWSINKDLRILEKLLKACSIDHRLSRLDHLSQELQLTRDNLTGCLSEALDLISPLNGNLLTLNLIKYCNHLLFLRWGFKRDLLNPAQQETLFQHLLVVLLNFAQFANFDYKPVFNLDLIIWGLKTFPEKLDKQKAESLFDNMVRHFAEQMGVLDLLAILLEQYFLEEGADYGYWINFMCLSASRFARFEKQWFLKFEKVGDNNFPNVVNYLIDCSVYWRDKSNLRFFQKFLPQTSTGSVEDPNSWTKERVIESLDRAIEPYLILVKAPGATYPFWLPKKSQENKQEAVPANIPTAH
jgi:hypothetical protein